MNKSVRFFYNTKGIGDVLLVRLSNAEVHSTLSHNNVTQLLGHEGDVVGYNVFEASRLFDHLIDGGYFFNQATYDMVQSILQKNGFPPLAYTHSHKFFVGQIISCESHPKSDHLHICKVDLQHQLLNIVCGASNVRSGLRVVCAIDGAVLPDGMLIEDSSLLGVYSQGMLCSYKELQIPNDTKGIIELDETYAVGSEFHWKGRME